MRVRWLMTGLVGGALIVPATAGADTYFVAFDASTAPAADCATVATQCRLGRALDLAQGDPAAEIVLAPGTYTNAQGRLDLSDAGYDGIVIRSADPADPARLQPTSDSATPPFLFGGDSPGGVTVRDVILDGSDAGGATSTLRSDGGTTTLEDVEIISLPTVAGTGNGVRFAALATSDPTVATLRRVRMRYERTVTGSAEALLFASSTTGPAAPGALTIEDSEIDVVDEIGATGDVNRLFGIVQLSSRSHFFLRRSHVRHTTTGPGDPSPAVAFFPPLVTPPLTVAVEDSAITGGSRGVWIEETNAGGPVDARVVRSSIDAGSVGVADAVSVRGAVRADPDPDAAVALDLRDNVLVGDVELETKASAAPAAGFTVTCDSNAIFGAVASLPLGAYACTNTTTGSLAAGFPALTPAVAGDLTTRPSAAHAAAWAAAAGAPSLDNATGTDSPAIDLAGLPRAVDASDVDCIAQSDRGAYEAQALATPAAQCLGAGPGPGGPGGPADPGAPGDPAGPGGPGVGVPPTPVVPFVPPAITPVTATAVPGPAKMKVRRAGVIRGRDGRRTLDVLALLTNLANGERVRVSYQSSGRTTRFTETVRDGQIRINRRLPRAQRKTTGIFTLEFAGSERVRPAVVRLRAASQRARLRRGELAIDAGRLKASGTISSRARGVVRVVCEYSDAAGRVGTLERNATIRDGRWSLDVAVPADARDGCYVSLLFTGYEAARGGPMRGEQDAKAVGVGL